MADRFFDSSAAGKHYRVELGTDRVDAILAETGSRHFISDLTVVELHSAFARLVRMGQISPAEFHLARGRFLADISAGLWNVLPLEVSHFHAALQLLVRHGLARNLRSLDALQLAAAIAWHADQKPSTFVCADQNLGAIAAIEGLQVVNPELP